MNSTSVILRQNVPNLGEAGDLVTVKPGFARNYLLPRGLAYEATQGNIRRLEDEKKRGEDRAKRDYLEARRQASALESVSLTFNARAGEDRAKRDYLEARRQASALEGVSLTFNARAGEESKLFGSITTADIAEKLNAEGKLGFQVDRRQVELDEPIKSLGVFSVPVKLHGDVRPEIKVWVIKEE